MSKKVVSVICLILISLLFLFGVVFSLDNVDAKSKEKGLTDQERNEFAQNDILFYNPGACISTGGGNLSVCSATLPEKTIEVMESANIKEKAQQNYERYKYAEDKTGVPWQAIAALHARESGMNPETSISNGQPLTSDGSCYSNMDGVKICGDANEDAVDAAKHLLDLAKMAYGVELTKSSTIDEWGQGFVAYNRGFLYKWANTDWKECPYATNGFDKDHELYMTRPAADVVSGQDLNVGALAVFAYLCGADVGSSSSSSVSNSSSSSSSNNNNCAKLGELRTEMWDKASQEDKESFMKTVSEENYSIAGVEGYMNQVVSKYGSDGTLHDWLTGQCEAFRPASATCTGSHTITDEEQKWIDEALAGSNNIKFAVGNATGGSGVGAGKIVCVWDGTKCRDDVDYTIQDGKAICAAYSSSADFGECWGLEGAEEWVKEMSSSCGSKNDCTTYEGDYPEYVQCDTRWGSLSYGAGNSYCSAACGATAMATIATITSGRDVFPPDITDLLEQKASDKSPLYYVSPMRELDPIVCEEYGCETEPIEVGSSSENAANIEKYLKEGWMIHASGSCNDGGGRQGHGSTCPYSSGGHYVAMLALKDSDTVIVSDPGWDGLTEYKIADLASGAGAMQAVRANGAGGGPCANYCKNDDNLGVNGGLTEEQAQKLVEYYNSDKVDGSNLPYGKMNCVSFVKWFIEEFTELEYAGGNGKEVAHNLAVQNNLEEGNEPRPFSVFSVTSIGSTVCEDGYICGHTGVVVAVDGDNITTAEAAFEHYNGTVFTQQSKSLYSNDQFGNSYVYIDKYIDKEKLKSVIGS